MVIPSEHHENDVGMEDAYADKVATNKSAEDKVKQINSEAAEAVLLLNVSNVAFPSQDLHQNQ